MKHVRDLVREHESWIRERARRYYRQRHDAEDLASETIFRCLDNSGRFDGTRDFKPWVCAIMSNLYITAYNRRQTVSFEPYPEYEMRCHASSESLAEISAIIRELKRLRKKSVCIDSVLLYAMGYTSSEISSRLAIPVGTVTRRISEGRKLIGRVIKR